MNALERCPQCGTEMTSDAPGGLCPRCLLRTGLESDADSATDRSATTPHRRFVPPTPAELAPHFPQLDIQELVGSGGMGAVYRARQKELQRTVALKILPPQLGADPNFAERFLREARAMARLSHPNIVAIFDFGRTGDLCYFTMEFVEGTNLRQVIKSERVASADALSIATQICDALQYAHEEGVVHRDIKPENILVSKLGRVKITDFGLAKVVFDAAHASALTGTAELLGTYRYMAPEQLEQSRTVDHRADIFALGIVLYELLTGEVPMGRFQPPSEKVNSDPRLDDVVLRALEPEPQRRYQRASDVKLALESIGEPLSMSGGTSALTSRWTSGMWSGIWSSATPRPASGWVVACRLLGMLVAFAGLMVACFMVWESVTIDFIDLPLGWTSHSSTVARQSSLGWYTTPGRLAGAAFGLVLLYLLGNLPRLRRLAQTYMAFFLCGFAVIGLSAWSLARTPTVSSGPIEWQTSTWRENSLQGPSTDTPRKYLIGWLSNLIGLEAKSSGSKISEVPAETMSNSQLIEALVNRDVLMISSNYWMDGPYAGMGLGIALAFVGLLEFIFTYAIEPTRRMLGGVRSSISSRFSTDTTLRTEPRISKMAVLAAFLALIPTVPLVAAIVLGRDYVERRGSGEEFLIAVGFLIGLSIFPIAVGSLAMYRIRRWAGLLHGLPLAFGAAATWAMICVDVLLLTLFASFGTPPPLLAFVLVVALVASAIGMQFAWSAARRPLPVPSSPS